ncbi:SDR family oxidoreductase [Candidatus Neomarinimicrobiota bacterium]
MARVVITGSNRGIGLELVRQHLQRRDKVYATCRSPELATELNNLQSTYPDALVVLPMDVTSASAINSAASVVNGFEAGLDLLVNNAGVGGDNASFGTIDPTDFSQVITINTLGPLLTTQAFSHLLKGGTRPVVANISSRMGSIADNHSGGYYGYRASKAALNMINCCMSQDLAPHGIISVAIHPGWVKTDMGGASAPLKVNEAVEGIMNVLDGLSPVDNGNFIGWDSSQIPW